MQIVQFNYKIGQRVKIKSADTEGVITGLLKDQDACQYRVVWWDDNQQRKHDWLFNFELMELTQA